MPDLAFELVRDARGSQMHIRDRRSGECLGCVEVGLFELVRMLIIDEERRRERDGVEVARCG
jgi:hypothetical protein